MIKWIIVFLVALFSLVACGSKEKDALGEDDLGREIEITVGEKILVTLDSNPTTGFQWEVAEMDESVLEQVGEAEYEKGSSIYAVGGGGEETLTFKAVGVGETELQLIYHQPWEETTPPVETFSVKIKVK